MRLLETLIAQAVRHSTGYNTDRIVRKIGGKNILLAGGAVLAGTLAADYFRQRQSTTQPSPVSLPPIPPPPPPPPPIPAATSDSDRVEIPPAAEHAIVRTMIAAALADGRMSPEERQAIRERIGASGFTEDQVRQLQQDMVLPPTIEELAEMATAPEARDLLFRFAALALLADRACSPAERAWLERLATALSIAPESKAEIERETGQLAGG